MCESNVYLEKNNELETLMENVVIMKEEKDGNLFLINLFGEQKLIKAKIKEIKFLEHKIILQELN